VTLTITARLVCSPITARRAGLVGPAAETQDDCDPEVYDETFWSRADEHASQLGLSGPAAIALALEADPGEA
jgi:hypothetical protein